MGKKYYCDYCEKSFKDDSSIRKKHVEGLPHQKARNEYYIQFKSKRKILQEEYKKKPCAKFPIGTCQFGASCRFSHYTPAQLANLQQEVNLENQEKMRLQQPKIYTKDLIDEFMRKRESNKFRDDQRYLKEFFKYPEELLKVQSNLPPSLRLLDPAELKKDFRVNEFG